MATRCTESVLARVELSQRKIQAKVCRFITPPSEWTRCYLVANHLTALPALKTDAAQEQSGKNGMAE